MKIRVGILDQDPVYVPRLIRYFTTHYVEQIEISAFGNIETFRSYIQHAKIDILLANYNLVPENLEIPRNMILAYLSESPEIETIEGISVVCKYQRAEMLYREILGLYAELDQKTAFREAKGRSQIYYFLGVSGGAGTTTMAAACAMNLAEQGKKVLYLNLEENGVIAPFLRGEGSATMSDVLYAVKSSRSNLVLKLESMLRRSEEGVYFYEPFSVTLDSYEMSETDLREILNTITLYYSYDYIIIDSDPAGLWKRELLMKYARRILLVSDGNEISCLKLKRMIQEITIKDENEEERTLAKVKIIFNRCSDTNSQKEAEYQELIYGQMKEAENSQPAYVVRKLARSSFFDSLK